MDSQKHVCVCTCYMWVGYVRYVRCDQTYTCARGVRTCECPLLFGSCVTVDRHAHTDSHICSFVFWFDRKSATQQACALLSPSPSAISQSLSLSLSLSLSPSLPLPLPLPLSLSLLSSPSLPPSLTSSPSLSLILTLPCLRKLST